jgi:hypothetical protein
VPMALTVSRLSKEQYVRQRTGSANTSTCVCFVSNAPMLRHSCDAKSTYAPSPPPFSERPGAEQPRTPPQWPWRDDMLEPASHGRHTSPPVIAIFLH